MPPGSSGSSTRKTLTGPSRSTSEAPGSSRVHRPSLVSVRPERAVGVIKRHDVGVFAVVHLRCATSRSPGFAERAVLALDSQPLDVVREVVARERVLVEDSADPGDRDPLVRDGVRPAHSLRQAQLRAQVLVAPLQVVALDDEPGGDRGEADGCADCERAAARCPGADVSARVRPERRRRRRRARGRPSRSLPSCARPWSTGRSSAS